MRRKGGVENPAYGTKEILRPIRTDVALREMPRNVCRIADYEVSVRRHSPVDPGGEYPYSGQRSRTGAPRGAGQEAKTPEKRERDGTKASHPLKKDPRNSG